MTPILKKLYSTDEELSEALKRHLVFFNTEGILGAIIQGIVISMEEQKSNGENITDDAITGIKTGLMGPVAGMGDAIIWAAVMPIIFSIFLPFASNGSALGGIMPLIFISHCLRLLFPIISFTMDINWERSRSYHCCMAQNEKYYFYGKCNRTYYDGRFIRKLCNAFYTS